MKVNLAFLRLSLVSAIAALTVLCAVPSQAADEIPLRNWTPAAYHPATSGRSALADIGTHGLMFVPFQPCRAVDTRNAVGLFGGPKFSAGEARNYNLRLSSCTGMSPTVVAYSVNLAVTGTNGDGFLAAYPQGAPPTPLVSSLNYTGVNQTLANAAVIPATSNVITVIAGVSGTHVIIDVNGYYTYYLVAGEQLFVDAFKNGDGAISGINSGSASQSSGVHGYSVGSGFNERYGVYGEVTGSTGVSSAGVKGVGHSSPAAPYSWGIIGDTDGIQTPLLTLGYTSGGVLGRGTVIGSLSIANYPTASDVSGTRGAEGCVKNPTGPFSAACGTLGYVGPGPTPTTYGLYSYGNSGASGTKLFIEPHPTDPAKVIRYVSLEGPEAGTYFRGSGRTVDGVAIVEVPESFRLVTDAEGLTVQITPKGDLPTATSVKQVDLDRIVVRTTRDVEFSYLVQGVRRTFKDFQVIGENVEYRPESASAILPAYLSPEQKRSLVTSGVYNEDGTVNMSTAERTGWARAWREAAGAAR